MIVLTKLRGQKFALNYNLIETIQENPDTTIKLSNGNVYIVEESLETILDLIIMYEEKKVRVSHI
ncbi:MAG: flagellar FlbD family protein [Clostridium sp.]|nr:flagellar FlbD family protein [Clostridium sp.]MCM1547565.1 flagellar FlbD family protein [Ruminococcus sp.]